ncbi:hypothetical protein Nepgr_026734 [Nepenthes gracilis]|uniref:FAD-binding domain-containing protein n=1 Tax=Nepenthes gracilis TaxID=150966 RepID=A0AAD3TAA9_NEPGR|nr:hypothetical protein Nepgr_026734 [Nepenthes gracilis]
MQGDGIVIVGGGICGLATALALHRKGIPSLILEQAESLRATGFAITIHTNGWRALDQLGVGSKLRLTARSLDSFHEIFLDKGVDRRFPFGKEEIRTVKRNDLIEAMAKELPAGTIHFGCRVVAITLDAFSSDPMLKLHDGSVIKSKVVIGCDGVNSVVSRFLELKPPNFYDLCAIRSFTNYPTGHGLDNEFTRIRKGGLLVVRAPVDDNIVYWLVGDNCRSRDSSIPQDMEHFKQSIVQKIQAMDPDIVEMVEKSDIHSLSVYPLRCCPPWDILLGNFHKGNVVVAGDAMHVMTPFLGQGGSACLEDAVVLARCMAQTLSLVDLKSNGQLMLWGKATDAFEQYIRERRMRLFWLSLQVYLIGLLDEPSTSTLIRFVCSCLLILLFRDFQGHTKYDCGRL